MDLQQQCSVLVGSSSAMGSTSLLAVPGGGEGENDTCSTRWLCVVSINVKIKMTRFLGADVDVLDNDGIIRPAERDS